VLLEDSGFNIYSADQLRFVKTIQAYMSAVLRHNVYPYSSLSSQHSSHGHLSSPLAYSRRIKGTSVTFIVTGESTTFRLIRQLVHTA